MSGDQYANKLEQWFGSLPGIVQEVLHAPFTWMNETLKSVAGDPQALLAAGQQYVQIGDAIHQVAQQQLSDRSALADWSVVWYPAATSRTAAAIESIVSAADAIESAHPELNSWYAA